MSAPAERPVDVLALARVRRRLLARAQVPWLHGEVARRMGERLAIVRDTPQTVLDWGRSLGGGLEVLASAYPAARQARIGDRPPGERASIAPAWWSRLARRPAASGVAVSPTRRCDSSWTSSASRIARQRPLTTPHDDPRVASSRSCNAFHWRQRSIGSV